MPSCLFQYVKYIVILQIPEYNNDMTRFQIEEGLRKDLSYPLQGFRKFSRVFCWFQWKIRWKKMNKNLNYSLIHRRCEPCFCWHGHFFAFHPLQHSLWMHETDRIWCDSCDMNKTVFFMKSFLVRMDKNCWSVVKLMI